MYYWKVLYIYQTWGPFLESPWNVSGPKSHSKISSLMITEQLYSQILNMKRSSLHTRSFRRKHFSVFRYWWTKNGFTGPKRFRVFRERAPDPSLTCEETSLPTFWSFLTWVSQLKFAANSLNRLDTHPWAGHRSLWFANAFPQIFLKIGCIWRNEALNHWKLINTFL